MAKGDAGVHPVDEVLAPGQLFAYGLQHVLAMYAGAVAVPLIIGNAMKLPPEQLIYLINADLFTCGVATLIQTIGFWKFGVRLPIIQGCTFAAVTPMILIGQQNGMPGVYGAVIAAGFFTMLLAPVFGRLLRFFPPVVIGTIITLIGISLLPVAVRWAGGGNPAAPTFGAPANLGLAAFVLVAILAIYALARGFWKNIAVLLGLIVGTIAAALLGRVNFADVATAGWFGITTPFAFGMPTFDPFAILIMVLVMLVVMTETMGDFLAVGEIVGREASPDQITDGLRADGLSTMLGGIFNAFPYTAYAQNVGLVSITGVKSRFVVAAAGAILVVLGLFPKLAAIVAAVPNPVLGGAGLVMFGMVAASGIRMLAKLKFEGNYNALVVAVSLAIGLIPVVVPNIYHQLPKEAAIFLHSGITIGSVVAILLNAILNRPDRRADAAAGHMTV